MTDLAKEDFICIYHVEIFSEKSSWLDYVVALSEENAVEEVKKTYSTHKFLKVEIKAVYDYLS